MSTLGELLRIRRQKYINHDQRQKRTYDFLNNLDEALEKEYNNKLQNGIGYIPERTTNISFPCNKSADDPFWDEIEEPYYDKVKLCIKIPQTLEKHGLNVDWTYSECKNGNGIPKLTKEWHHGLHYSLNVKIDK